MCRALRPKTALRASTVNGGFVRRAALQDDTNCAPAAKVCSEPNAPSFYVAIKIRYAQQDLPS